MAGLKPASGAQLRAIALLRWHLVVNSLRSVRGRLNLVSRAFGGLLELGTGVIGGSALFLAAAWATTGDHDHLQWLAVPFWIVFLFWQLFPVMATAFTQNRALALASPQPGNSRRAFLAGHGQFSNDCACAETF